jgi:hypothetical protein
VRNDGSAEGISVGSVARENCEILPLIFELEVYCYF